MQFLLGGVAVSVGINAIAIFIPSISILGWKDGAKQAFELLGLVFVGAIQTAAFSFYFYNAV